MRQCAQLRRVQRSYLEGLGSDGGSLNRAVGRLLSLPEMKGLRYQLRNFTALSVREHLRSQVEQAGSDAELTPNEAALARFAESHLDHLVELARDAEEPESYELAFRPLTEREREILDFLLTANLPGIEKMRDQAETARAVRYSSRDPSFGLWLDSEGPLPSSGRARPVIQTYTKWQGNKDGLYSLILWADSHGGPGSVELTPFHDSGWPAVLPPPSEFEPPEPYEPGRMNRE